MKTRKILIAAYDDRDKDSEASEESLISLLGEDDYLTLLESYAGVRLYIPNGSGHRSSLVDFLSVQIFEKLSKSDFSRNYIRVPLSREFRCRMYRNRGWSNAKIARLLGITETRVNKIIERLRMDE